MKKFNFLAFALLATIFGYAQGNPTGGGPGTPPGLSNENNPNAPQTVVFPLQSFCGETELDAGCGYSSIVWDDEFNTSGNLLVTGSGTYTATVQYANGFFYYKEFLVEVNPLPVVDLGGNIMLCSGDSTTIDAGTFTSYLWSSSIATSQTNGVTTQTINVSETGTYTVVVTNDLGCEATSSIEVIVSEPIVLTTSTTETCWNSGSATVQTIGGVSPYTYEWMDASGNSVGTGIVAENLAIGSYTVTVTDANGCSESSITEVQQGGYCSSTDLCKNGAHYTYNTLRIKLKAHEVLNALAYRFNFYGVTDHLTYTQESETGVLPHLLGVLLNGTTQMPFEQDYLLTVQVKDPSGNWNDESEPCLFTLDAPNPVYGPECGLSYSSLKAKLTATAQYGFIEYRYIATGDIDNLQYGCVKNSNKVWLYEFWLNSDPASNVQMPYNQGYSISVQVKYHRVLQDNPVWSTIGDENCHINLTKPTSRLWPSQCAGSYYGNERLTLYHSLGVSNYRITFVDVLDSTVYGPYDNLGSTRIYLEDYPGLIPGRTYSIEATPFYFDADPDGNGVGAGDWVWSDEDGITCEVTYLEAAGKSFNTTTSGQTTTLQKSKLTTPVVLKVYPNPNSTGEVNVVFEGINNENVISYQVVDASGKLVFETQSAKQNETIDVSGYTSGIYFIQGIIDGEVVNQQLIIE